MKKFKIKISTENRKLFYIFAVILALAIASRFILLGVRPIHHDEGMLAYFAWKLARFGEYNYTPQIHAPILFYVQALLFLIFGESAAVLRTGPAIFGVVMITLPLIFYKKLGKANALAIAILILTSPLLTYYSRFLVHTSIVIVFWFLTLVFIRDFCKKFNPFSLYLTALCLAFSFGVSETTYIFCAALLGAALLVLIFNRQKASMVLKKIWAFCRHDYIEIFSAFLIFVLAWMLIYGVGLTNPRSLITSLPNPFNPESGLGFWLAQNPKKLGGQKWHYYFDLMMVYEPVILIGFVLSIYDAFKKRALFYQLIVFCAALTLAVFSCAGEKFPWLALCPLILMIFSAGFYWGKNFSNFKIWSKLTVAILITFSIFNLIRLNYFSSADTSELAVYVQTPEFARDKIDEAVERCEKEKIKDCVAIEQKISWPLSWYFRRSSYLFVGNDAYIKPETKYAFVSVESVDAFKKPENWAKTSYPLRDWWVPDVCRKLDCVKEFADYYFKRSTWNTKGGYDVYEFSRNQ